MIIDLASGHLQSLTGPLLGKVRISESDNDDAEDIAHAPNSNKCGYPIVMILNIT